MSKDLNQLFEGLYRRYFAVLEHNFKHRLKRAEDKEFVFEELTKSVSFALDWLGTDENKKEMIEVFENHYKRGETTEYIFNLIRKSFGEGEDVASYKIISEEGAKEIKPYLADEKKQLRKFASNERALTKFFVRYLANKELKNVLPEIFSEVTAGKNQPKDTSLPDYEIKWTGNKENKNEFVQIIYALHAAGRINNGKGEITKIVEELSKAFNLKLGNNWQSNHSNSIHKRRADYEPPIFKEIEQAYKRYELSLIDAKKKRG